MFYTFLQITWILHFAFLHFQISRKRIKSAVYLWLLVKSQVCTWYYIILKYVRLVYTYQGRCIYQKKKLLGEDSCRRVSWAREYSRNEFVWVFLLASFISRPTGSSFESTCVVTKMWSHPEWWSRYKPTENDVCPRSFEVDNDFTQIRSMPCSTMRVKYRAVGCTKRAQPWIRPTWSYKSFRMFRVPRLCHRRTSLRRRIFCKQIANFYTFVRMRSEIIVACGLFYSRNSIKT